MCLFFTVVSHGHKWTWWQETGTQINTEKALYAGMNVTFDKKLVWHFLLHLFLALVWESSGSTHLSSMSSGWARITLISSLCSQSHSNIIRSGSGDEVSVYAQVCFKYDLERCDLQLLLSISIDFYFARLYGNSWLGNMQISNRHYLSQRYEKLHLGHDSWRVRQCTFCML